MQAKSRPLYYMNGYFFTGSATHTQVSIVDGGRGQTGLSPRVWTSCTSQIVCADDVEEAQKRFEELLCAQRPGESPIETVVNRIFGAQMVDELLTEKETVPMDWVGLAWQAQADLESNSNPECDPGYWLDANEINLPASSVEELQKALPEELRSGLNWAEDKQFFFVVSVLAPPSSAPSAEIEDDRTGESVAEAESAPVPDDPDGHFPELVEKMAAAVIRARNSAVAVWLWRNQAAGTGLAGPQIRIDPWSGIIGPNTEDDPDAVIANCAAALELEPASAALYLQRGQARLAKGDLTAAVADFSEAIALKPDYVYRAYLGRGAAKYKKKEFGQAITDFDQAIALHPDAFGYFNRGLARKAGGDEEGALADYKEVVELDPELAKTFPAGEELKASPDRPTTGA